jgi:DNA-binding response OmpR family regulator
MRLLIVDDDRALGVFLTRGLEADGHRERVVTVTDTQTGVNAWNYSLALPAAAPAASPLRLPGP